MRCKYCDAIINVLDTRCSKCGRNLSILYENQYGKDPESVFGEKITQQIENEVKREDLELYQDSSKKSKNKTDKGWMSVKLDRLGVPDEFNFAKSGPLNLEISKVEHQQIVQFVRHSIHVQSNLLYRQRASQTTVFHLFQVNEVNAYATDRLPEDIPVIR